jgi:hypothetical protein
MELKDLGPYRIERSEDWGNDPDRSYAEMIRVRGSRSESPHFIIPSHLYKYSESELALYMKDRKNAWRSLGDLLNEEIEISEPEMILRFPLSRFPEVSRIVPFVRKRGSGRLSSEMIARRDALNARRHTDKMGRKSQKSSLNPKGWVNTPQTLDLFISGGSI